MELKDLIGCIIESESVRELMGLRVCIAIFDDLESNIFLNRIRIQIIERIKELLESEL